MKNFHHNLPQPKLTTAGCLFCTQEQKTNKAKLKNQDQKMTENVINLQVLSFYIYLLLCDGFNGPTAECVVCFHFRPEIRDNTETHTVMRRMMMMVVALTIRKYTPLITLLGKTYCVIWPHMFLLVFVFTLSRPDFHCLSFYFETVISFIKVIITSSAYFPSPCTHIFHFI